ncbi:MAG: pirin family protein [Candidatus Pacearchaeota archaeon]
MGLIHRSSERGRSEIGWLHSRFSFSFADYNNSARSGFGKLLVLNDDIIEAGKGFGAHSHDNMEIITLVTHGELQHKDSLGNSEIVRANEMQVMSAGRGITHSEYNNSKNEKLELFQIWVETARPEITPRHETRRIDLKDNTLTLVVSGDKNDKSLFINQDAKIYLGKYNSSKEIIYDLKAGRGLFVFVIEGSLNFNGKMIEKRDSLEITDTKQISLKVNSNSYFMIIDVPFN